MSDQSRGSGWWLASDGKWYAPELHPLSTSVSRVPRVAPTTSSPIATQSMRDGPKRDGPKRDGQPRHWLIWAPPVIAAAAVIAVVLSLTLGGPSATSTSTPRSDAGAAGTSTTSAHHAGTTDLTGTYVGVGQDNSLTMLLELSESGSSLTGTLIVNGSHYSPTLGNKPAELTAKVDSASNSFSGGAPTFGLSFTGEVAGSLLELSFSRFGDPGMGNYLDIDFHHGTVSEFQRLIDKNAPSVANAQVNLLNAMAVAKAVYQIAQTYRYDGVSFESQAPEFIWTPKQCNALPLNCISFRILDLASTNDAQGLALAVYSPATSTCWYAIDIETTPKIVPNDLSAFVASASDPNASVKQPGVYYARSPVGSTPSSCIASLVVRPKSATWVSDYANAGGLS
jgi:hypothetical protein